MIKRREFLIGGTLIGFGSVNLLFQPPTSPQPVFPGSIENLLPQEVGGWISNEASAAILPPNDDLLSGFKLQD